MSLYDFYLLILLKIGFKSIPMSKMSLLLLLLLPMLICGFTSNPCTIGAPNLVLINVVVVGA